MFGKREAGRTKAFPGLNVEAPLWIILLKAFGVILFSDILLLMIFLLGFGELNRFLFGFLIFVSALQIFLIVGLRIPSRTRFHLTHWLSGDFINELGAWWLVSCAFGALFGWICSYLAVSFPDYENIFLSAAVFFTIFLPVLTMLPRLRFLERDTSYKQIPLLFFVTILPVLVGFNSFLTLWNLINPWFLLIK